MAMTQDFARTLLRASWWAILLGLVLEGVQLAVIAASHGPAPVADAVIAESVQKMSWSTIVCVALACGTAATRAGAGAIGVLGLFAAPAAFAIARALHKSAAQALSITVPAGGPSPWALAGVKALEYAVFGYLVTRLLRRPELRLGAYARTGALIGTLFGAALLALMEQAAAPDGLKPSMLVARGLNELLFPIGCACVLWVTGALARAAT
ncbi:MAG TPA: hypothetical protein VK824_00560 [Planctomycetota bacterium]|nr:hypothetical protein [Planctomycetota bacterium]